MASGFCSVRGLWPGPWAGAGSVSAAVRCLSRCPALAAVGLSSVMGYIVVGRRWRVLWASWAALGLSSGVRSGRPLSWRCGRCGGPWGGPAAVAGIVAGRRVLGAAVDRGGAGGAWVPVVRGGGRSAVQPGRLRLLCMVPELGCVLRSAWAACLGCWRRCLPSMSGRDHGRGRSCCCRGPFPVRVSSPTA